MKGRSRLNRGAQRTTIVTVRYIVNDVDAAITFYTKDA